MFGRTGRRSSITSRRPAPTPCAPARPAGAGHPAERRHLQRLCRPRGAGRPWSLDLLPLILPADEWRGIATAIAQRARLLDTLLGDLYGPRPPSRGPPAHRAGVWPQGFLWPCQGIRPAGGHYLHLYAADLARSPDGRWWVIADRTQAPSGAGYALENRLLVSRAFPDLFRDMQVHTLAGFFRGLQRALAAQAPGDGEPPLTVLLTPGPFNETYFEHVYLARYLGFPLVEGRTSRCATTPSSSRPSPA
jgi:uncharacterized circularly permuted ATP-grasp superfamily protein